MYLPMHESHTVGRPTLGKGGFSVGETGGILAQKDKELRTDIH